MVEETSGEFSLWLKLVYTVFFLLIMYVNFAYHGWRNVLWFSHIALVLLFLGLWTEKRVLVSMAGISVLFFHSLWTLMFLARLLFGFHSGGAIAYVFDAGTPLYLRSVTMFHVATPPLILYLLSKKGYDRRAFRYQKFWGATLILITYLLSPQRNVNWVHGPVEPQSFLHPYFYLAVLITVLVLFVYLPTHLLLDKFFGQKSL